MKDMKIDDPMEVHERQPIVQMQQEILKVRDDIRMPLKTLKRDVLTEHTTMYL